MSRSFLDHKAEHLAMTGYRCAMAGYDTGDPACWDDLWDCYVAGAGLDFTCASMGSLHYFIRTLRQGLGRGTHYYPRNCRRLCRQECLVMALLSSLQHDDGNVSAYTLQKLLPDGARELAVPVATAARQFADALGRSQFHLMHVPYSVIFSIAETAPGQRPCPFQLQ